MKSHLHLRFQQAHCSLHLVKHGLMGQKIWHLLADSGLPCHHVIWQILSFGFVQKDIKVQVTFPSGTKVIETEVCPALC